MKESIDIHSEIKIIYLIGSLMMKKHSKLIKPITKEAAIAIKEKQKQLNARPIKKF